ncbi:hypothetical protein [Moorena sp. SIOASIH]|nr:hypothetical protein [Moorena sp. SIOASIH]
MAGAPRNKLQRLEPIARGGLPVDDQVQASYLEAGIKPQTIHK